MEIPSWNVANYSKPKFISIKLMKRTQNKSYQERIWTF